jgi:Protein of unknown function (DUF3575)
MRYALFLLLGALSAPLLTAQSEQPANAVKLGLENLVINRRFDLAYERRLAPQHSIQLKGGIGFPTKLPGNLSTEFQLDANTKFVAGASGKWNSGIIMPEYRFYPISRLGDALKGFYVGAYFKINLRGGNLSGTYTRPDSLASPDVNGRFPTITANANLKATWNTVGGGVMLGYQFLINERFCIDLTAIGLGVDVHKFGINFSSTDPGLTRNFETWSTNINDQLSSIPIIGKSLNTSTGTNSDGSGYIASSFRLPFVGVRFNISIGYAF